MSLRRINLKNWRISSNAIYPFKSGDGVHFLRLAPSDEKDATQIRAELEFLNYLKGKKYPAVEPVISKNGIQLEVADTPWGIFYATTFKEVPGKSLEDQNLDEQKIYKWRKSLGQLHTHSQQFKPTEAKRMDCLEFLNWVEGVLTVFLEQENALEELKILKEYFSQLEITEHNYGLIHYDFDDAMYHWYGMDIEQALESMRDCEEIENFDDARTAFIEGYRSERPLTNDAFKTAKMFRRFANLYGYTRVLRSVEEQLEEESERMLTLRSRLAQTLEKRSTFFGHDIDETLGGNQMNLFFEVHKDIPREGPGTNESTKKAFNMLGPLPLGAKALDIGCGPGMQTIELARHLDGHIVAIDPHEPFLDKLKENASKEGVLSKITVQNGSMFDLQFDEDHFDLIWSEGAIFIIGFDEGIKAWRKYLKTDGYLVVSEISWLRNDAPKEAIEFWEADYPSIKGIGDNINLIQKAGYSPVGHFVLPEIGWWENYYNPLIERINLLRVKYQGNQEANEALDNTMKEIDLYRKYSDYFGYVFYLMKKI